MCDTGKVWVMKSGYGYGLWDLTELWEFPANGVGASGCQNLWVITGYGLSQRWVMTESTVVQFCLVDLSYACTSYSVFFKYLEYAIRTSWRPTEF
jgi:hypothetical protein